MKYYIRITMLFCCTSVFNLYGQQDHFKWYGDNTQANDIALLSDSSFAICGALGNSGFLLKVNPQGDSLDQLVLSGIIPGNSTIRQVLTDQEGNLLAAGECEQCLPGDPAPKVFVVKTNPNLELLQSRIYPGPEPGKKLSDPKLARLGQQILLAATKEGTGLNFEDYTITGLMPDLDPLWQKTYNSCSNCGFERLVGFTHTADGFAALLKHPFTDSLTMYGFTPQGEIAWKKRLPDAPEEEWSEFTYHNGHLYAGVSLTNNDQPCAIVRFNEQGDSLNYVLFINNAPQNEKKLTRIKGTEDGKLLALEEVRFPDPGGDFTASYLLRIDPADETLIEQIPIPQSNQLTQLLASGLLPLNQDGTEFAICGTHAGTSRAYFYSRNTIRQVLFNLSSDTLCAHAMLAIQPLVQNAISYEWYLDGAWFSSDTWPAPFQIEQGGLHVIELRAVFPPLGGSDFLIDSFIILSLPRIWNECAFCDNKPDPFVVFKDNTGQTVYVSPVVEDYPPTIMPVNFRMKSGTDYTIEVWDYDLFPPNDFFGSFMVHGYTTDTTLTQFHPNDTIPLSISFTALELPPAYDTVIYTRVVFISQPAIESDITPVSSAGTADGAINLNQISGGLAPYSFLWSNGAQTQNLSGIPAGNYSLTITDQAGCQSVFSFLVETAVSAGEAIISEISAVIVPNPSHTDGSSILQIRNRDTNDLEIKVLDATGRTLSAVQPGSDPLVPLPKGLAPGLYFVNILDSHTGQVKMVRWVVN